MTQQSDREKANTHENSSVPMFQPPTASITFSHCFSLFSDVRRWYLPPVSGIHASHHQPEISFVSKTVENLISLLVSQSIHPSTHPSIHPVSQSFCLAFILSVSQSVSQSVCQSVSLSVSQLASQPASQSVSQSVLPRQSFRLSVCKSIKQSVNKPASQQPAGRGQTHSAASLLSHDVSQCVNQPIHQLIS